MPTIPHHRLIHKATGWTIWDVVQLEDPVIQRAELTSLLYHQGYWYCAFREGATHWNHPSGRGRILRSRDGKHWLSVCLLQWNCGDVREPRLSVTAEGHLMVNTSVFYVSREPRLPGNSSDQEDAPQEAGTDSPTQYYQLDRPGTIPYHHEEAYTNRQSVSWISKDGLNWEGVFACPTGFNTWRWDVTWHNGMGYSVAYSGVWGNDQSGALYRTRDGKNWRCLLRDFFPDGEGNEGSLAFAGDNTAYCLLRQHTHGVIFGIGEAPYYQKWNWQPLQVDWFGNGNFQPTRECFRVSLGGPHIQRLSDGRLLAAGRTMGPDQEDGRIALFWIDPDAFRMTRFAEVEGTSYPGVVERDGSLWVSSVSPDVKKILLTTIPIAS